MNIKKPHQYPNRVLLVVIGMTPQIVTETMFRLAVRNEEPFVPTEVHIITTTEGAESAANALLGVRPGSGWMDRFKLDFALPSIEFTRENIHVIADTEGGFIDDSQSTEHNRIASDYITRIVKALCTDKDSSVHVSLAGGRKTMSFYAGYALSLYGRVQDRLSHVLVNLPFQNNKDFFYPRPVAERIEVNNQYYSTDDAKIILSDIPFVRMKSHFPIGLLQGTAGFQETVDKIARFAQPEQVRFDHGLREVQFNGLSIQLPPADYAFYLWMCERCSDQQPPLDLEADEFMSEFLRIYALFSDKHTGHYKKAEKVSQEGEIAEQKAWFQSRNSALKRILVREMGRRNAAPFLIQTEINKSGCSYQIGLDFNKIDLSNHR